MKITLTEWAARRYSKPPSQWVLAKWRREGQIHPRPERVGREWFVPETAERITKDTVGPDLVSILKRAA